MKNPLRRPIPTRTGPRDAPGRDSPRTRPGSPGLGPCRRSRRRRARDRATTEAMRQIRARRIRGPAAATSPERAGRRVTNGFAHPSPQSRLGSPDGPTTPHHSKRIVGSPTQIAARDSHVPHYRHSDRFAPPDLARNGGGSRSPRESTPEQPPISRANCRLISVFRGAVPCMIRRMCERRWPGRQGAGVGGRRDAGSGRAEPIERSDER